LVLVQDQEEVYQHFLYQLEEVVSSVDQAVDLPTQAPWMDQLVLEAQLVRVGLPEVEGVVEFLVQMAVFAPEQAEAVEPETAEPPVVELVQEEAHRSSLAALHPSVEVASVVLPVEVASVPQEVVSSEQTAVFVPQQEEIQVQEFPVFQ
jgi:hypothetical protein